MFCSRQLGDEHSPSSFIRINEYKRPADCPKSFPVDGPEDADSPAYMDCPGNVVDRPTAAECPGTISVDKECPAETYCPMDSPVDDPAWIGVVHLAWCSRDVDCSDSKLVITHGLICLYRVL